MKRFSSAADGGGPGAEVSTRTSSSCIAASASPARESCSRGLCGCCTVVVDGTAVSGCLYLAMFVDGTDVVTVEHAAGGDGLDAVQKAFVECDGFQCGFCPASFS